MLILLAIVALLPAQRPRRDRLTGLPWWGWAGGACGAVYVASTVLLVPEFGAAVSTALLVSGQNIVSLAIDHYGWVWLPRRPATVQRLVGVGLLLVGVVMIQVG